MSVCGELEVSQCLSIYANIAQIVGLVLAIFAAVWAYLQLKAGYKQLDAAIVSAKSQAVLSLDQTLANYEPLRRELNKENGFTETEDNVILLRRYIAVFERLGLLLKTEVVDEVIADQFYGARLKNLLKNSKGHVQKTVADPGWENFIYLWERMRKLRDLPDIKRSTSRDEAGEK